MKDVIGYEGLYRIDEYGNVYSLGNGNSTNPNTKQIRKIKSVQKKTGYIHVKLHKDGKRYYVSVHRLVALNFIPNPLNLPQVNHKDGNKENNHYSNLEWCTAQQNIQHSFKNKLQVIKKGFENSCSKQVKQLDLQGNLIKIWGSINDVKRELGFNSVGIIGCCKKRKKYKTAYNFKWEYA